MKLHNKKTFFAITLLTLLIFGVSPLFAHAGSGFMGLPTISEAVTGGFKIIAYIFNFIGGLAFTFANYLVKFALYDLNFKIMDVQNSIVHVGWAIARDVANLGFVLTIVIIAFTTIIRIESYGAKKLLPKLIAAAIIVNFSLAIAGVFIDFSNVVTSFFLEKSGASGSGEEGITARLANAFGPQRFMTPAEDPLPPNPEEEMGLIGEIGTAFLTSVTSLAFIVIFTLIATIVLLALAAMLIVRYVQLSLLLVASPLVWLFWVFPGLGNLYSKWWDNFIKWVFFAPAVSFCLYITLISVDGMGKLQNSESYFSAGIMGTIVNQGAQMVVVSFMLILGLIAAEKMGISGATAFKGAAMGVVTGAKNIAKNRGARIGQSILQRPSAQKLAGGLAKAGALGKKLEIQKTDKWYTKAGKGILNATGVGMNLKAVSGAAETIGKGAKKVAGSPRIKEEGIAGTMWKSIKKGAGIKEEEKKKEEKTYEELEKEHDKLLEEKKQMRIANPKIKDEEMKGINDELEKTENAMHKEYEKPETVSGFVEELAELKKKREDLITKGEGKINKEDLSYYDDQIKTLEKGFDKSTEREPGKMRVPELERHITALNDAIVTATAAAGAATDENVKKYIENYEAELEGMKIAAVEALNIKNNPPPPAPRVATTQPTEPRIKLASEYSSIEDAKKEGERRGGEGPKIIS
ncbi:MAG: hypothetical protein WCV80_02520 [Candidatus Paceibacterota bacterium]|jgi:hypothetical protein